MRMDVEMDSAGICPVHRCLGNDVFLMVVLGQCQF